MVNSPWSMVSNLMKFVLGISGASGTIYAVRLIHFFKTTSHVVELAISANAIDIARDECGYDLRESGYPTYNPNDFSAPFASGSAQYDGLAVVPCSMGTLGRIAHGYSDNLISRTADVFLKERRKTILVPRETPFNLVHIENMRLLAQAGAIILPAIPSFYSKPTSIEEAADTVVARILDHLGIDNNLRPRYGDEGQE